jgi:basic membrane protein A
MKLLVSFGEVKVSPIVRGYTSAISLILALIWIIPPVHAGYVIRPRIAIIYESGGRGDSSIDDAAAAGVDAAKKKYQLSSLDIREVVTDGTEADREKRLRFLAKAGYALIITVGNEFASALSVVGVEFALTQFAIINDQSVALLNVTSAIFDDSQSAFLAGAFAALESKVGKVGFISDPITPRHPNNFNLKAIQSNFIAGAKYINSKVKVFNGSPTDLSAKYIGVLAGNGVDVVYSMWDYNDAVVSAITAINGVSELKGKSLRMKLIGVRPDQFSLNSISAKKILVGSIRKRFDKVVVNLIETTLSGRTLLDEIDPIAGVFGHKYTLQEGMIDFTFPKNSLNPSQGIKSKMAQIMGLIHSGKIHFP